jgi:DNA polymerase I-like protein with 3'-5' exonuclease and polymerase domains/uracil-DNA glycosylase
LAASYDPRDCGALCDECPLQHSGWVPPPGGDPDATFAVLGEAPTFAEVVERAPVVGRAEKMIQAGLSAAGLSTNELWVTRLVLCRPTHGGPFDKYLRDLIKVNDTKAKAVRKWARSYTSAHKNNRKRYEIVERALERWRRQVGRKWEVYLKKHTRIAERRARYLVDNAKIRERNQKLIAAGKTPRPYKVLPELPEPPANVAQPPEVTKLKPIPTKPVDTVPNKLPTECCAPRLERELAKIKTVVLVGAMPLYALTGRQKMQSEVGFPVQITPQMVGVPVYPPGMILTSKQLKGTIWGFYAFLRKAVMIHRQGGLFWEDPFPYYKLESLHRVIAMLLAEADRRREAGEPYLDLVVDIETDAQGIKDCSLRCVGIAWPGGCAVIPIYSVDGTYIGNKELLHELKRLFLHRWVRKITHNGPFDWSVLLSKGLPVAPPFADTMFAHHTLESEAPHGLDYVSALTTLDAPSWKEDAGGGKHGVDLDNDMQLWRYNGIDVHRTFVAHETLEAKLKESKLDHVYAEMCELLPISAMMTKRGLWVHEENRRTIAARLQEEKKRCYSEMLEALDEAKKGASPELLAEYAELLGGDPFTYSRPKHKQAALRLLGINTPLSPKTGLHTAAAEELIRLLPELNDTAAKWIGSKISKTSDGGGFLGTGGCDKLHNTFCVVPAESDGRVRASWKIHGTANGRWSCSPNMQNLPKWIRAIYGAPPGWKLVGADYSALELWIVAIYTAARRLLEALESADVHRQNTEGLFSLKFVDVFSEAARTGCKDHGRIKLPLHVHLLDGDEAPEDVVFPAGHLGIIDPGKGKLQVDVAAVTCEACRTASEKAASTAMTNLTDLRVQGKRFVYNANYEGSVATIWAKLSVEFRGLQLGEVDAMMRAWKKMCPEIGRRARENENLFYRRRRKEGKGYLESPILGRTRYWIGKEFGLTDAANFPIQSASGDIVNQALIRVHRRIRLECGGYIVAQIHDQIVVEVPEDKAELAKRILEEEMPGAYKFSGIAGTWSFPVEADIGDTLDQV